MSDDTLYEQFRRGQEAHALLEHELLKGGLAKLEQDYIEAWKRELDSKKRDICWYGLKAIEMFKGHLNSVIASGSIARVEIEQIERRLQRINPKGNG
jgi:hypothetical protein